MEILKILLDLLCFVMVVVNMYKFNKDENVFDKISFGTYMLFWLLLLSF
jgi:hypothetical protein